MGEHKYNPTAIKAKNGEIEPKKKSANPITKAEVYEMVKDALPMYREMEATIYTPEMFWKEGYSYEGPVG